MPEQAKAAHPPATDRIALYDLDAVRAALGASASEASSGWFEAPRDTEHQTKLAAILDEGEDGRWRRLVPPAPLVENSVASLTTRAAHFGALSEMVGIHVRAARTIGLPTSLPPVLLVGGPGIGKSWYLSRLSATLGLPFRRYSMSTASLAEGLQGSHPSWRNAEPGLVARTLLGGAAANPVLFVDELDKAASHSFNHDPFRAFYSLLDPSDSVAFVDEYLGFAIDASRVVWVLSANDADRLPAPIRDRLTVLDVPYPDDVQRIGIAASVYAEANAARLGFFEALAGPGLLGRLSELSPRAMRKALDQAMARAAADGLRVVAEDLIAKPTSPRGRIGFHGSP